MSRCQHILQLISVIAIVTILTTQPTVAGSSTANTYSEFLSCDQCTIFNKALWCPTNFKCLFYNETPQGKLQAKVPSNMSGSAEDCRVNHCGGTACIGFLDCFFGVSSCGECMYLGGAWCAKKKQCFPRNLVSNDVKSNNDTHGNDNDDDDGDVSVDVDNAIWKIDEEFSCAAQCGGGDEDDGCYTTDDQCPPCERYDAPLRCSKILPVLIVSVISSVVFLGALGYTLFVAHGNRTKVIGPETHIGPISGNLMESPGTSMKDPLSSERL